MFLTTLVIAIEIKVKTISHAIINCNIIIKKVSSYGS